MHWLDCVGHWRCLLFVKLWCLPNFRSPSLLKHILVQPFPHVLLAAHPYFALRPLC